MKRLQRIDRVPIRLDASKIERDSRGFARVWGKVVPINALLTYGRADGYDADEHVEFVPEETVTDPEALATLMFAPITMPHPPEMLDSSNTARHQIGTIIDTKIEDGALFALHLFTDDTALRRIDGGVVELSPGYTAEIDETPGTFDGQPYAAIQRNRRYNHQAVVDQARAGEDNRLLIDSKQAASGLRIQVRNDEEKTTMAVVTIDEKEFEVADEVAAEMARLQEPNKDAEHEPGEEEEPDEEETEDAGDDDPEDAVDAEGSGTPAPAPQAPPPKTSGTPEALAATKADGFGRLLARLDGLEDRVAAKLETQAKVRRDSAAKAKRASERAYVDARGALSKGYDPEGKSADRIMRDAVVARNPDLKAKADAAVKFPGRLRGMFDAEMARAPTQPSHPLGDVVPEADEKRDPWQKRVDAVRAVGQTHRILGNEAMRHTLAAVGAN